MSPKIREIFDKLCQCNNFVPNPKFMDGRDHCGEAIEQAANSVQRS